MSTSMNYFSRGLTRAFERRAKESARQKNTLIVQKVDGNAAITTTHLDNDEQYRVTTIQNMLNYIKQKKEVMNND